MLPAGIGVASTILVFWRNVYYNIILAWTFYYLFASFTSLLPWSHCGNDWNTKSCRVSINDTAVTSLQGHTTPLVNETWLAQDQNRTSFYDMG